MAGGDRNESMVVSEKSPIYSGDDGDWQRERERDSKLQYQMFHSMTTVLEAPLKHSATCSEVTTVLHSRESPQKGDKEK